LASGDSTVLEHSPHNPKVEGMSPAELHKNTMVENSASCNHNENSNKPLQKNLQVARAQL